MAYSYAKEREKMSVSSIYSIQYLIGRFCAKGETLLSITQHLENNSPENRNCKIYGTNRKQMLQYHISETSLLPSCS